MYLILAAPSSSERCPRAESPKHASVMNQAEFFLSILVRKSRRRGSFTSVDDLAAKAHEFVDHYSPTMAKPFKWTYQGKALTA